MCRSLVFIQLDGLIFFKFPFPPSLTSYFKKTPPDLSRKHWSRLIQTDVPSDLSEVCWYVILSGIRIFIEHLYFLLRLKHLLLIHRTRCRSLFFPSPPQVERTVREVLPTVKEHRENVRRSRVLSFLLTSVMKFAFLAKLS